MKKIIYILINLFIFLAFLNFSISSNSKSSLEEAVKDFKDKNYEESIIKLEKLEYKNHLLGDYILFLSAESYFELDEFQKSKQYYNSLIKKFKESPLIPSAMYKSGLIEYLQGNFNQSINILEQYIKKYPNEKNSENVCEIMAKCYKKLNKSNKELKIYYNLIRKFTGSSEYRSYFDRFIELCKDNPEYLKISQQTRYNIAEDLRRKGRLDFAIYFYKELINNPIDKTVARLSLYGLGQCYFYKKENKKAEKIFKEYINKYPWSSYSKSSLLYLMRIYDRQKNNKKLYATAKKINQKYSCTEYYYEALFRLAVYNLEFNNQKEAKKYLTEILESGNNSIKEDTITKLFWLFYNDNDYENCKKLIEHLPRNSENYHQLLYWIGYIYLKEGEKNRAEKNYRKIIKEKPYSYYGFLAQKRTQFYHLSKPLIFPVLQNLNSIKNYHIRRLIELERCNLSEYSILEYRKSKIKRNIPKSSYYFYLAKFLSQSGEKFYAYQIIDRHFKSYIYKNANNIPSDFWAISFPDYLRGKISTRANNYNIDKNLISALIREESFFEEDAISPAGAIGLMQIMPEMVKDNRKYFKQDLFDVNKNLDIGIQNFNYLMKKFDNNPYLAIAAHNAGVNNVKKWSERLKYNNEEEFIEQIPFRETRNFVKRVLTSYYQYIRIYKKRALSD